MKFLINIIKSLRNLFSRGKSAQEGPSVDASAHFDDAEHTDGRISQDAVQDYSEVIPEVKHDAGDRPSFAGLLEQAKSNPAINPAIQVDVVDTAAQVVAQHIASVSGASPSTDSRGGTVALLLCDLKGIFPTLPVDDRTPEATIRYAAGIQKCINQIEQLYVTQNKQPGFYRKQAQGAR
jgi:hypothetical protein